MSVVAAGRLLPTLISLDPALTDGTSIAGNVVGSIFGNCGVLPTGVGGAAVVGNAGAVGRLLNFFICVSNLLICCCKRASAAGSDGAFKVIIVSS